MIWDHRLGMENRKYFLSKRYAGGADPQIDVIQAFCSHCVYQILLRRSVVTAGCTAAVVSLGVDVVRHILIEVIVAARIDEEDAPLVRRVASHEEQSSA